MQAPKISHDGSPHLHRVDLDSGCEIAVFFDHSPSIKKLIQTNPYCSANGDGRSCSSSTIVDGTTWAGAANSELQDCTQLQRKRYFWVEVGRFFAERRERGSEPGRAACAEMRAKWGSRQMHGMLTTILAADLPDLPSSSGLSSL